MKKECYLSADSGGSKTVWVLQNSNGERLSECKTDGLGAIKEGLLPVEETVNQAKKTLDNIGDVKGVFLSLGGPNTKEVEKALRKSFGNIPITVEREASGNGVLYAAKYLGCKAVVMCGTGSVAVGDTCHGRKFCGGWGPVLADEGSGGGLGCEAVKLYLRGIDGIQNNGGLREVFAVLNAGLDIKKFADRMELKNRAVNLSRKELAAFNPKIWEMALSGDEVCMSLYEKSAKEIALMASAVSDNNKDYKVLLCGGFFKNGDKFVEMCRKHFSKISDAKLIYNPDFTPLTSACVCVLEQNGIKITKQIFENIITERYEKI